MLNAQKGNMYPWITHTWNTIKGECPHDCAYCYMKKYAQAKTRFDEKELRTDLETGNFIFVGSSCDMFADEIPIHWIERTLFHCKRHNENKYLFQSKNPARFRNFYNQYPEDVVFGTTIESNRDYPDIYKNAPDISQRYVGIHRVANTDGNPVMVTIEPIMDFDLDELFSMIADIEPEWVNIGANTRYSLKLPEPDPDKVHKLIGALGEITEVKIKDNLKRLT